jgi:tetratricopeptide (TPR) repeat protein
MPDAVGEQLLDEARSKYELGEFRRSWELAQAALAGHPDDPGLLQLAGKAGLELDEDEAVEYLRKASELAPENADAWRDLGEALVVAGQPAEALEALRRAAQLRPEDLGALVDLAHLVHASGDPEGAIELLEQVVARDPGHVGALRSLADMYRSTGREEEALATLEQLAAALPDDALAALDLAELNLDLGLHDEAAAAFRRLRDIDDEPDHEIFAYHGMIETELRRERWRSALDIAVDATRVDRFGRTTAVLAYVVSQVFGPGDRPAPSREEIDEALASSRAEHRQLHSALVV